MDQQATLARPAPKPKPEAPAAAARTAGPRQARMTALAKALNGPPAAAVAQRRAPSAGGLPDGLREGAEALSGIALDDVKVHYNSAKPARLGALAHAQGSDIHLGPGQERHLPHEAWHVVQQRQGRVRATAQLANGVPLNDDMTLEREADRMGAQAMQRVARNEGPARIVRPHMPGLIGPVQRVIFQNAAAMWAALAPGEGQHEIEARINGEPALAAVYNDALLHLQNMNFVYEADRQPVAAIAPNPGGPPPVYNIIYGHPNELDATYQNPVRYAGAVLHEMMHIATALQYATNTQAGAGHIANMNLPLPGNGPIADAEYGLTDVQFDDPVHGAVAQVGIMQANWNTLRIEADLDEQNDNLTAQQNQVIQGRCDYAQVLPGALAHYDTVLTDLLYYLCAENAQHSRSYDYARRMLVEANARRLARIGPVQAIARAPLPIPAPPQQSFFQWLTSLFSKH